jgi:hypothetical protein
MPWEVIKKQSALWKCGSVLRCRNSSFLSWNLNVCYRVHKILLLKLIFIHMNRVDILIPYFFGTILILSSHLRLNLPSHLCLSVIRNEGHYMLFMCYFHANFLCCTHHHCGFDLPYIIRWWLQNTKPLILQYFLVSRHLRLDQCVINTLVSNNFNLWFYFFKKGAISFSPYKTEYLACVFVCWLSVSEVILTSLTVNITNMINTFCCVYSVEAPDVGQ